MLVLSRRVLETLRIGEHITITVFGIKGGQVRLGIDAPVDMAIHRVDALYRRKVDITTEENEKK